MKIFIREYGVPREEALLKYSWEDIQDFINALPIERVVTVYQSKEADNKGRYLAALCDKDVKAAEASVEMAMEELERRKALRAEKLRAKNV